MHIPIHLHGILQTSRNSHLLMHVLHVYTYSILQRLMIFSILSTLSRVPANTISRRCHTCMEHYQTASFTARTLPSCLAICINPHSISTMVGIDPSLVQIYNRPTFSWTTITSQTMQVVMTLLNDPQLLIYNNYTACFGISCDGIPFHAVPSIE